MSSGPEVVVLRGAQESKPSGSTSSTPSPKISPSRSVCRCRIRRSGPDAACVGFSTRSARMSAQLVIDISLSCVRSSAPPGEPRGVLVLLDLLSRSSGIIHRSSSLSFSCVPSQSPREWLPRHSVTRFSILASSCRRPSPAFTLTATRRLASSSCRWTLALHLRSLAAADLVGLGEPTAGRAPARAASPAGRGRGRFGHAGRRSASPRQHTAALQQVAPQLLTPLLAQPPRHVGKAVPGRSTT